MTPQVPWAVHPLLPVKENVSALPVCTSSSAEEHASATADLSVELRDPLTTVQTWLVKLKSHRPQYAVAAADAGQTVPQASGVS